MNYRSVAIEMLLNGKICKYIINYILTIYRFKVIIKADK